MDKYNFADVFHCMGQKTRFGILNAISENPGITGTDIADLMCMEGSACNESIRKMCGSGILLKETFGRGYKYTIDFKHLFSVINEFKKELK